MALLPITVVMLVFSARSGRLAAAIGPRLQMAVGPVVVGAGLALLSRAPHSRSYVHRGAAGRAGPRDRPGRHGGPAHLHRPQFGPRRLGPGWPRRSTTMWPASGGLIAVAVLPALGGITGLSYLHPQAAGPRIPAVGDHRRPVVRGGRSGRRHRHPEPSPSPGTGRPGLARGPDPLRPRGHAPAGRRAAMRCPSSWPRRRRRGVRAGGRAPGRPAIGTG